MADGDRPDGIYARLDTIREDVSEMKRWLERHDVQHGVLSDYTRDRALLMEHRITSLERAVGTRTMVGSVGIILSWIAAVLGMSQKW